MNTSSGQLQKPSEEAQQNQQVGGASSASNPVDPAQTMMSQPATNTQQTTEPSVTAAPAAIPSAPMSQQPVVSSSQLPEHEPLPSVGANEWAKLSEPEVVLPDEVIEAGVEAVPLTPSINSSQQAAGVMPAKESTPVQTEPTEAFHFPFTQVQTEEIMHKDKDIRDSLRWLALLIFREIAMARRRKQLTKPTV